DLGAYEYDGTFFSEFTPENRSKENPLNTDISFRVQNKKYSKDELSISIEVNNKKYTDYTIINNNGSTTNTDMYVRFAVDSLSEPIVDVIVRVLSPENQNEYQDYSFFTTLFSAPSDSKQNIYVAPWGSDNAGKGTFADPYQSPNKGLKEVAAGGTVHLYPGTYIIENIQWPTKDNLTLTSFEAGGGNNKNVILDGSNAAESCIDIINSVTLNIAGLTFQKSAYVPGKYCICITAPEGIKTITNCIIKNVSRGICISGANNVNVINTKIINPSNKIGELGIAIVNNCLNVSLENCLINNLGGGLCIDGRYTRVTVNNCTFWPGESYAIFNQVVPEDNITILNSILWDNGTTAKVQGIGRMYFYNCNVKGGVAEYPGADNINEDPLFVDPQSSNFKLKGGSPCIDSGTTNILLTKDIENNPRPLGYGYDMGAYESTCTTYLSEFAPEINSTNNLLDTNISFRVQDYKYSKDNLNISIDLNGKNYSDYTIVKDNGSLENTDMYLVFDVDDFSSAKGCVTINVSNPDNIIIQKPYCFFSNQEIIFVAPWGDDTNGLGTTSNPYKTPQQGLDLVAPGGTVYLYSGTYNIETIHWPGKDNLTLSSYAEDGSISSNVILDAKASRGYIYANQPINLKIIGIIIQNAGNWPNYMGIDLGPLVKSAIIEKCIIRNNGIIANAQRLKVSNSLIYECKGHGILLKNTKA
ncbi:MAG: hypothetical protein KKA19_02535, partial [Candidatus Margulisbacteria bacterium]|nr:hypothetical protein [Candidatus Margulisiibacteriota bacterium]